ncbi:hypothetical protein SAMN05444410_10113 [Hydrobacter penzbergensis]|uniref:Uncharacterized protein n=1 Tax=Hydrobacter penzbergensis TaxID=1235997 RepID=A0A8X8IC36_9BACT|nr:hypothetical protein [Hydrobacter penzbergensis]SDW01518.1 hypothetical protein SAMN05444410_10113 [Hydrobacter penzbergensis]
MEKARHNHHVHLSAEQIRNGIIVIVVAVTVILISYFELKGRLG